MHAYHGNIKNLKAPIYVGKIDLYNLSTIHGCYGMLTKLYT